MIIKKSHCLLKNLIVKINDPKYNPTLEFIFSLENIWHEPLFHDNFILVNYNTGDKIEINEPIKLKYSISK